MSSTGRRAVIVAVLVLLLLVAGGVAALHYAASLLKGSIETALGPESTVGSIAVEGRTVVVRDIVMRAPAGWPTPEALRAERIVVSPDLAALVSGDVRISSIVAERVYLAAFRTPEGKLELLPSLLGKSEPPRPGEPTAAQPAERGTAVIIDRIDLHDGALELFDAQVRAKPYRVRIEALEATVGPLALPMLDAETELDVDGTVKGPRRDGSMAIDGDIRLSDLDSKIALSFRGVDLVALEPYLLESTETGVKGGTLDLSIESTVAERRLSAPGTMTLSNLELTGSTFMGMSQQAVLAGLKDRNGTLTVRFELAGSLDDPKFSLHQNLAMRVGTAVADGLGLSVRGLAEGLGGVTHSATKKLGELLGRRE